MRRIGYLLLALSLLPGIGAVFAYGTTILDYCYLAIGPVLAVGLLYLCFSSSKAIALYVFFVCSCMFALQLFALKELWFNSDGGDPRVPILFSLQALLIVVVLVFLSKESEITHKFKSLTS